MKPNYIGIGAQKCASTWVHRILEDHPEAGVSEPKELDFFSYHYGSGFRWYEKHFKNSDNKQAIGEISPSYFHDPLAPARAASYNHRFRVIVTLRDPVERAYSNHLHELRLGHCPPDLMDFEAGLTNNPGYLDQSRYATHLKRWLACFPRDQILILLQEEIKQNPDEQAKCVYEFLGINTEHRSAFLHKRANVSAEPKSQLFETLLKKAGRMGRRLGLTPLVEASRHNSLITSLRSSNTRELREVVPSLSEDSRRKIALALASEMIELASLLQRDHLPWPTWQAIGKKKQIACGESQ